MTLYQLEVLLAVVDTGSFTKAGELLHASQSGVSHTISDLEKELGVLLFSRSRSGVKLTDTGAQIAAYAREILNQTAHIHQIAAAAKGVQRGTLRMGSFPSFSVNALPGISKIFRDHYPNVELHLFEGSYAEIDAWITAGTIDLGFLSEPSDSVVAKLRIREPLVVLLPLNHPLSAQESVSIEEMEHEPFLLLKSGCERRVFSAFREKGLELKPQVEVSENTTLISMVEAGIGVTIVPSMVLTAASAKVAVKPLTAPLYREVVLAVLSQQEVTPLVAAFIQETQSWLASAGFGVYC